MIDLKMTKQPYDKVKMFFAIIATCALLSTQFSCSTTGTIGGGDPVLVNAQRATTSAFHTFDAFVHLEYNHRADLASQFGPAPHKLANEIRMHGQQWIRTAITMENAYEANRTAENKVNMISAVALVQTALTEIQQYMGGH